MHDDTPEINVHLTMTTRLWLQIYSLRVQKISFV